MESDINQVAALSPPGLRLASKARGLFSLLERRKGGLNLFFCQGDSFVILKKRIVFELYRDDT